MSNYEATIVKIDNLRDHCNADRLQITNIFGNNIIVGKNVSVGDIGVMFPLESQIGKEFAEANDLIRRKDENGNVAGGMFDQNRRVKAQKLRGEKSMGFWCPIDYLHKTFDYLDKTMPPVEVGDSFEELNGVEISKKYQIKVPQEQKSKSGKKAKVSRVVPEQFHFHFDTEQLGKNAHKISPDDLISVTWKFHGTSAIVGNVLCKKKLSLTDKVARFFGANVYEEEYDYLFSSRRVIKNDENKDDKVHYYSEDIWTYVGEQFRDRLHKGETVYMEIVGYTPSGEEIQKKYDYGCKQGEHKVFIYRITQTNVDGIATELPWHQVKQRSKEIGFDVTPEIFYGRAGDLFGIDENTHWNQNFLQKMYENYVYDQRSQFCMNKVPEEGVVVRVERGDGIENFKLKAFSFLQHETKMLDKGEQDLEETQNVA